MTAKTKKLQLKFELTKHPAFRVINVNQFFGGLSPNDGRIQFYTDIFVTKMKTGEKPGDMEVEKINRELQVDIRLSVMDFVRLATWMNTHVKRLEDQGMLKKGKHDKSSRPTDYSV